MRKPIEWHPKQLALAVYVHLYSVADLGMPLEEVLRLAGLSKNQWESRIVIDFPAQEGTSPFMPRINSWYEDYLELKRMPRADLHEICVGYLANVRLRKG